MSRRRSARVALITAAGLISAGAITWLAVPASAATPTVSFGGGGCTLLASKSYPNPDTVTTQKSSTSDKTAEVVVVNNLNTAATPYVDGRAVKQTDGKTVVVKKGESVTVPFFSGPAALTLEPDCGLLGLTSLSKQHKASTVKVQEAPKESTNEESAKQPGQPGGQEPGSDSGSRSGSDSTAGEPDAGSRPDAPKDPVARGAKPPEDVEGGEVGDGAAVDDEGDAAGAPAGGDNNNRGSAAGRGKAGLVSTSHSGPGTTTLALIAVICLLGVAAAALRTIVVSRAARVSSI